MFHDTRPAALDSLASPDTLSSFKVEQPHERLALLRTLRDGNVPITVSEPSGASISTSLWSVDSSSERLSFNAEVNAASLQTVLESDEATAVAYLDSVKLQFDLHDLVLVKGTRAAALQSRMPGEIYRFQRRSTFRVRPLSRHAPSAVFRHPAMPEMALALRLVDVSMGGCALWLPKDVPPLQAGTVLAEVRVHLDEQTQFGVQLVLQYVSALFNPDTDGSHQDRGVRLGCAWKPLSAGAERVLQHWIDQAQRRHRLLSLS